MYLQLFIPFILFSGGVYGHYGTEDHKDRAGGGEAGAAARCATEGVGTAEIDLIHALRHHPGCTQAALAELLHADKAAIARRTKNLEAKGYLVRRDAPERPAKPAFVSHRKGGER